MIEGRTDDAAGAEWRPRTSPRNPSTFKMRVMGIAWRLAVWRAVWSASYDRRHGIQ